MHTLYCYNQNCYLSHDRSLILQFPKVIHIHLIFFCEWGVEIKTCKLQSWIFFSCSCKMCPVNTFSAPHATECSMCNEVTEYAGMLLSYYNYLLFWGHKTIQICVGIMVCGWISVNHGIVHVVVHWCVEKAVIPETWHNIYWSLLLDSRPFTYRAVIHVALKLFARGV